MKVAIMQPYFFPYIGYFQLMAEVDCFVFYDDAQFMKNGWVNRNRILRHGEPSWWTYPVIRDGFQLTIRQRQYSCSPGQSRSMLGKIEGAYREAPCYSNVQPILADFFEQGSDNIAEFNGHHLKSLARSFGIQCQFLSSSEVGHDRGLGGQDRVIAICRSLGATKYVNPIGGLELYQEKNFESVNIELAFLQAKPTGYPQFNGIFVPYLSIVDVLMFNTRPHIQTLLGEYELRGPLL